MALQFLIPTQVKQTITTGVTAYAPSEDAVFDALALKADASALSGYQPLDSDLTAIATLTTDSFGRDLLTKTTAANVRSYIGAGTGSGDALVANPLSQFAATLSSQLAGVISDETGSGSLVFNTSPSFLTSTALTLTDAVTNAATTLETLTHNSSGAIAANFGLSKLVQLQSTTTASRDAGKESWAWSTATDATRTSKYSLSMVSSAGSLTEYYRFNGNGLINLYSSIPGFVFSPATDDRFYMTYQNARLYLSHQLTPFAQMQVKADSFFLGCDSATKVKVGVNEGTPTAQMHIAAGSATASTAPLKLTSGTNLTTPENGAFEYDGTNLYFTTGGVRKTVTLV